MSSEHIITEYNQLYQSQLAKFGITTLAEFLKMLESRKGLDLFLQNAIGMRPDHAMFFVSMLQKPKKKATDTSLASPVSFPVASVPVADPTPVPAPSTGLEERYNNLKNDFTMLQKEHEELEKKHANMCLQSDRYQAQWQGLSGTYNSLLKEHAHLSQQYEVLEKKYNQCEKELESVYVERDRLGEENDQLRESDSRDVNLAKLIAAAENFKNLDTNYLINHLNKII